MGYTFHKRTHVLYCPASDRHSVKPSNIRCLCLQSLATILSTTHHTPLLHTIEISWFRDAVPNHIRPRDIGSNSIHLSIHRRVPPRIGLVEEAHDFPYFNLRHQNILRRYWKSLPIGPTKMILKPNRYIEIKEEKRKETNGKRRRIEDKKRRKEGGKEELYVHFEYDRTVFVLPYHDCFLISGRRLVYDVRQCRGAEGNKGI